MLNPDLLEKNKNMLINFAIIILAFFIAFRFYSQANSKVNLLMQQQERELKVNKAVEEVSALEKKGNAYKQVFVKKDLTSIMEMLAGVSKVTQTKIESVKPGTEDSASGYLSSTFLITLKAPSYHALGDFISRIESQKDVYLISEMKVVSNFSEAEVVADNIELTVSLRINTITYL